MAYERFNQRKSKQTIDKYLKGKVINQSERDALIKKLNEENYKWGTDSSSHLELEGQKPTLGYEIETINGTVPASVREYLNVEAVHDGSLRGPNGEDPEGGEYVTGVLYGDHGFQQLNKLCNILQKHCKIDRRCGVHIHIGSLNWSEEDLVYCYALALHIEKEGYSLLPTSRRENRYCGPLQNISGFLEKLYSTRKLDRLQYKLIIEELYNELFLYVSGGVPQSNNCNKNTNHPKGSKCGYSRSSQRYCWMNFVTLIFDTKGNPNAKTLEIRHHGATMNYTKIKNWTKIWVAFANFVTNYKQAILNGVVEFKGAKYPLTLETMVAITYPKSGQNLINFMRKRKDTFKTEGEEIDYVSSPENEGSSLRQIIRN